MDASIIQRKILEIRGEKVILDFDLAILYSVETKVLNQTVKRNSRRFPSDFMFQLSQTEFRNLKSQIVTSSWGGLRKRPFAFTEHGVAMLAGILRSETAVDTNVFIIRAFIQLRHVAAQYKELAERLALLEENNEEQFREINEVLNYLVDRKQEEDDYLKNRPRIGFNKQG